MSKQTFAERCQIAEQCLPDTMYRALLTKLHTEMLEALAEQPAQQEPVAWMYEGDAEFDGNDWRYPTRVTTSKQVAEFHGSDVRPLYTTPQAQPLTPEWYARWIRNNYQDHPNIATLCDEMTKAAHGITKGTP